MFSEPINTFGKFKFNVASTSRPVKISTHSTAGISAERTSARCPDPDALPPFNPAQLSVCFSASSRGEGGSPTVPEASVHPDAAASSSPATPTRKRDCNNNPVSAARSSPIADPSAAAKDANEMPTMMGNILRVGRRCDNGSALAPPTIQTSPAWSPPLKRARDGKGWTAAAAAAPTVMAAPASLPAVATSAGPRPCPRLPALPPSTSLGVPEKLGDQPLRMIIVGHNPSAHAWQSGHYYSNPSNHMWRLLISTGIAPPGTRGAEQDDMLPEAAGVGFLDVGCGHPGTDSTSFKSEVFRSWSQAFYDRLRAHMARAAASIGCRCGRCGAPCLVAFSGKRQYLELLNVSRRPRDRVKTVEYGPQKQLPPGWPLPEAPVTEVWVCSSTSGAAAMTRQQREDPYRRLAERMREVEWPRRVQLRCG